MTRLLIFITLGTFILCSRMQVSSAETWSHDLVRRGAVSYRPASELTDPAAVRTCLVEGFGLQAVNKDLKIFSQNGEDGIISYIFNCIGVTDKLYVEFGTENGSETNSRALQEHYQWSGLLMDGGHTNPAINLQKEFISSENIVQLFHKYKVPKPGFDLMSADIDLNTFWVLSKILAGGYRPRLLVVEFNKNFDPDQSYATMNLPDEVWYFGESDGRVANCYFGASMLALERLVKRFGYSTVGVDRTGTNIFFVHESAIGKQALAQSVTDAKFAYNFTSLHGACPNTLWLAVPEDVPFEKPGFRMHMPVVMLRHHYVERRRRLYEVDMDPLFHIGNCGQSYTSSTSTQLAREKRARSTELRNGHPHALRPMHFNNNTRV